MGYYDQHGETLDPDARVREVVAGPQRDPGSIDDVALMTPPAGFDLALTVDALVGGVHFFNDDPPETIARKGSDRPLIDTGALRAAIVGVVREE